MRKSVGYVISIFLTVVNFALFYLMTGHLNLASIPPTEGKMMFGIWLFMCFCIPTIAQLVHNHVESNK